MKVFGKEYGVFPVAGEPAFVFNLHRLKSHPVSRRINAPEDNNDNKFLIWGHRSYKVRPYKSQRFYDPSAFRFIGKYIYRGDFFGGFQLLLSFRCFHIHKSKTLKGANWFSTCMMVLCVSCAFDGKLYAVLYKHDASVHIYFNDGRIQFYYVLFYMDIRCEKIVNNILLKIKIKLNFLWLPGGEMVPAAGRKKKVKNRENCENQSTLTFMYILPYFILYYGVVWYFQLYISFCGILFIALTEEDPSRICRMDDHHTLYSCPFLILCSHVRIELAQQYPNRCGTWTCWFSFNIYSRICILFQWKNNILLIGRPFCIPLREKWLITAQVY